MKHILFLFIILSLNTLYSCEEDTKTQYVVENDNIDDISSTQLLFSAIEYDLYTAEKKQANRHTNYLIEKISQGKKLYCTQEIEDVQRLISDLETFETEILYKSEHSSLEELRDLKGRYIMLQTKDDHDPYLYQLWRYEEEMYYTTKAAMDPKLDLYEWGEFQMMVDCMNENWYMVNLHYPSIELFGNNKLGYKIQTTAKIHLQKSMDQFNIAVQSDDYQKYDLCNHGMLLRESYIKYINTFIGQDDGMLLFLAVI